MFLLCSRGLKLKYREWREGGEEFYVLIPRLVTVVHYSRTEASRWVDASSSDGNGRKVNHEHCKSNGKRSQHLHITF